MGIASAHGRAAERLAEAYLALAGLEVVGRNVRIAGIEIDLVARERGLHVLIEVKYRGRPDYGGAAAAVDRAKRERLLRAAAAAGADGRAVRLDVVAIERTPTGARIEHYRNAAHESAW